MTRSLQVLLLYNAPVLHSEHPDYASETGVLESVEALGAALERAGHHVGKLAAGDSIAALVSQLDTVRPDVVVNLCEGFAGCSAGESHVAALLELLRLPYTGSAPECLALVRDKARTKRVLAAAGVPTPEFIELPCGQSPPELPLRQWLELGPLIVKPAREDASLGIGPESVVTDWPALLRQITAVHERFGDVLVERYIPGREFNVGIIELPELHVLPLAEIVFHASPELPWPIVTYAGKWSPKSLEHSATPVRCPAILEVNLARRIQETAIAAYRCTGCRDYARVDFRVDGQGHAFVLEVNANPDVGPSAGLPQMLHAADLGDDEFAQRLVQTAMTRSFRPWFSPSRQAGKKPLPATEAKSHKQPPGITIRPLSANDPSALLELTRSTGLFRPDEIEVAAELIRDALRDGPAGSYQTLVAELRGRPVGWSCHGRVPLTDAAFDLYWIVVAPEVQGSGIGGQLLAEVEMQVRSAAGRWLLAETSSTAAYQPTRAFYVRRGFRLLNEIDDFYRPGDGKVTFGKRLDTP